MISYLGITFDELLQTFEDNFVFADDRADRTLEEAVEVNDELDEEDDEEELVADSSEENLLEDDDEDSEDDEDLEVFIDDEGRIQALGQTVPDAADAAIDLLTDYIVSDNLDEEWLTLDQARGALLALRMILPTLEDLPEIESAYSFSISRDPKTGYPNFIKMQALSPDSTYSEKLTFDAHSYEGVLNPDTSLLDLVENAGVPEAERVMMFEVISEGVYSLAEKQCAIVFDIRGFCDKIAELVADHKNTGKNEASTSEIQH